MALWKKKPRQSTMHIPERREPWPVDASFTIPAGGPSDISVAVTATAGEAPGRGEPPILTATAEWDGILDGEDPFGVALTVTMFNAANAAPRFQLYTDHDGHTRIALDTVLAGFLGFTQAQIDDWVRSISDLGEQLADLVAQTWPQAPRIPPTRPATVAPPVELTDLSDLPSRLAQVVSTDGPVDGIAPVTAERVAGLLFGTGSADRVEEDADGSRRVGFHWNGYDITVMTVHGLLTVDTGTYVGGLDREALENFAASVAAYNDNITGNTAALVNLGDRQQPDWVVRSLIYRPASDMTDNQLELTVMSMAAMVSKAVADLLGRPAPGAQ